LYQHFASKEHLYEEVLAENSAQRESYIEAILAEPTDFVSVLKRMTRIYVENVSRDSDFLRMELMSALEGSKTASAFFERRWHSITDYIEYTLKELQTNHETVPVNPRMAGLMYQGMLREMLYTRFITEDARYQDIPLETMIDELITLFARAIGKATKA
jgi:AcrR family transcriptional regulator